MKLSMGKLSVLGLVLTAAAAVTAAFTPKEESKQFNGIQAASTGGAGNQITCINQSGTPNCTFTADSGTTNGNGTSGEGNPNTDTANGNNSSQSPS